jgi:hypothetical protein
VAFFGDTRLFRALGTATRLAGAWWIFVFRAGFLDDFVSPSAFLIFCTVGHETEVLFPLEDSAANLSLLADAEHRNEAEIGSPQVLLSVLTGGEPGTTNFRQVSASLGMDGRDDADSTPRCKAVRLRKAK